MIDPLETERNDVRRARTVGAQNHRIDALQRIGARDGSIRAPRVEERRQKVARGLESWFRQDASQDAQEVFIAQIVRAEKRSELGRVVPENLIGRIDDQHVQRRRSEHRDRVVVRVGQIGELQFQRVALELQAVVRGNQLFVMIGATHQTEHETD